MCHAEPPRWKISQYLRPCPLEPGESTSGGGGNAVGGRWQRGDVAGVRAENSLARGERSWSESEPDGPGAVWLLAVDLLDSSRDEWRSPQAPDAVVKRSPGRSPEVDAKPIEWATTGIPLGSGELDVEVYDSRGI